MSLMVEYTWNGEGQPQEAGLVTVGPEDYVKKVEDPRCKAVISVLGSPYTAWQCKKPLGHTGYHACRNGWGKFSPELLAIWYTSSDM